MGYDLHIERTDDSPITLDEWRVVVESTEGVRFFAESKYFYGVPVNGKYLSYDVTEGDSEVWFPDSAEWLLVFHYDYDSVSFSSKWITSADSEDPVWRAAVTLANRLDAAIVGDEGETYDMDAVPLRTSRTKPSGDTLNS